MVNLTEIITFIFWFSFHSENFRCVSCKLVVDKPNTRIQLEVFLSSSLTNCTLKVKVRTVSLFYLYFSINILMSTVWWVKFNKAD